MNSSWNCPVLRICCAIKVVYYSVLFLITRHLLSIWWVGGIDWGFWDSVILAPELPCGFSTVFVQESEVTEPINNVQSCTLQQKDTKLCHLLVFKKKMRRRYLKKCNCEIRDWLTDARAFLLSYDLRYTYQSVQFEFFKKSDDRR